MEEPDDYMNARYTPWSELEGFELAGGASEEYIAALLSVLGFKDVESLMDAASKDGIPQEVQARIGSLFIGTPLFDENLVSETVGGMLDVCFAQDKSCILPSPFAFAGEAKPIYQITRVMIGKEEGYENYVVRFDVFTEAIGLLKPASRSSKAVCDLLAKNKLSIDSDGERNLLREWLRDCGVDDHLADNEEFISRLWRTLYISLDDLRPYQLRLPSSAGIDDEYFDWDYSVEQRGFVKEGFCSKTFWTQMQR